MLAEHLNPNPCRRQYRRQAGNYPGRALAFGSYYDGGWDVLLAQAVTDRDDHRNSVSSTRSFCVARSKVLLTVFSVVSNNVATVLNFRPW